MRRFGRTLSMARLIAAGLAGGATAVGGVQATTPSAQVQSASREMAAPTEQRRTAVDAMVLRKKGKLPRIEPPRKEPIWVGEVRLKRHPELGESDPLRTARRAMWREARRKYPGISGRQFVKARKVAQRAVRT